MGFNKITMTKVNLLAGEMKGLFVLLFIKVWPLRSISLILAVTGLASLLTSVHASPSFPLYDRLGGFPVLEKVVSRMVDLALSDKQTRRKFDGISLSPLKESVATHLCEVTGGPCEYKGASIRDVHDDLNITADEFAAMDRHLAQALAEHGVPSDVRRDLLRLLGSMKPDVVSN